ncbi:MAG: excinuclease ABC subunit B, partial [Psychromonas sp.]
DPVTAYMSTPELKKLVTEANRKMEEAAKDLDFLQAAKYRDEVKQLKAKILEMSSVSKS